MSLSTYDSVPFTHDPYRAAPDRYRNFGYRRVGRSGLQLPPISVGFWYNFGDDRPSRTQREIVRYAFDHGITHFDLANNYGPPYGAAEENFGRVLRHDFRPYRDELVISTKAGWDMWPGPYGEFGSWEDPLSVHGHEPTRMGLRSVDILCLDLLGEEAVGCILSPPHAQGIITGKYLAGVPAGSRATNSVSLRPDQITEDKLAKVRALSAIAERRGQPLAQMALAWALRDPRVTSAIVGASSVAQLEENVGSLQNPNFSAGELDEIDRALNGGADLRG